MLTMPRIRAIRPRLDPKDAEIERLALEVAFWRYEAEKAQMVAKQAVLVAQKAREETERWIGMVGRMMDQLEAIRE